MLALARGDQNGRAAQSAGCRPELRASNRRTLHARVHDDMLRHMRKSIELSDGLLDRARKLAKRRGVTLRALVEEGLRRVLAESGTSSAFRLNDVTYGDGGLVEGLAQGDWERVRDIAYEGRGS